jgi:hypothetical protein
MELQDLFNAQLGMQGRRWPGKGSLEKQLLLGQFGVILVPNNGPFCRGQLPGQDFPQGTFSTSVLSVDHGVHSGFDFRAYSF